jgi:hypothetical protein
MRYKDYEKIETELGTAEKSLAEADRAFGAAMRVSMTATRDDPKASMDDDLNMVINTCNDVQGLLQVSRRLLDRAKRIHMENLKGFPKE